MRKIGLEAMLPARPPSGLGFRLPPMPVGAKLLAS